MARRPLPRALRPFEVRQFRFLAAALALSLLLQRRVPTAMLGRVSSLDFFVSVLLMPVSMAVAGPVGEAIGLRPVFLVAGLAPVALAVLAVVLARMPHDEVAHPLDVALPRQDLPAVRDGHPTDSAPPSR